MQDDTLIFRQLRYNVLREAKKHFNASDRKNTYHKRLGLGIIVISFLCGSYFFYLLTNDVPNISKYIGGIFSYTALLLSILQTYFSFDKLSEGHKRIGNKYLKLRYELDDIIAQIDNSIFSIQEIAQLKRDFQEKKYKLDVEAEFLITSASDDRKAKMGIESGEGSYKDGDLNL